MIAVTLINSPMWMRFRRRIGGTSSKDAAIARVAPASPVISVTLIIARFAQAEIQPRLVELYVFDERPVPGVHKVKFSVSGLDHIRIGKFESAPRLPAHLDAGRTGVVGGIGYRRIRIPCKCPCCFKVSRPIQRLSLIHI